LDEVEAEGSGAAEAGDFLARRALEGLRNSQIAGRLSRQLSEKDCVLRYLQDLLAIGNGHA
jgi:hypothetical protein